jgi:hypothetical protein
VNTTPKAISERDPERLTHNRRGFGPAATEEQKMSTTKSGDLTIIRHENDPLISVYHGSEHKGLIWPPLTGAELWVAKTAATSIPGRSFSTEDAAIAWLAA